MQVIHLKVKENMADVPWESEESRNFICMQKIVTVVVREGLMNVFKSEWNSRYQASFGAWDDTIASGGQLHHIEKARKRPNKNLYQSKFQIGDTKQWDCSVLFDAILYSISIGSTLNSGIKTEVDKLRVIRNEMMHSDKATLTDLEFQTMISDVENSFKILCLPINDLTCIKKKRNRYTSFQILPPKPTHEVVNRSEKIREINQDLQKLRHDNDGKLTYFYISGNPGSGKTQLSRQLGEDLYKSVDWRSDTAFVMTLNAKNLNSLLCSYESFCRRLNCNEDVLESLMNSSKPKEEKIKDLRTQITTRIQNWKSWWIIVDNVENLDIIYPLLPQMADEIWNNGQIILTIQNNSSVPSDSLHTKHASLSGGMNDRECRQLLSLLSGTNADDPSLDEVADKLDHQPLAMAAAAVYVRQLEERKFSWRDYLEKLEKGKRHVTEKRLQETNLAYSSTMSAAVHLAVQKSAENDFILTETFNLFSLISFEALPIDIIVKYIQQRDKNCEKEEIYLAIKHCSLFLFTENETNVRLHRVVHEATESHMVRDNVYDAAKALYCFKERDDKIKILPHLKSFNAVNKLFSQQDLLDSILKNHESAEIYRFFGQTLLENCQLKLALEFLNTSLEICSNSGRDPFDVFCELGETYNCLGEYNKSIEYHQRALVSRQNHPNDIDVATSYNNLGLVHEAMGELDQAKDYLQQALEIFTNVLGPNHKDVAESYSNLGLVYRALGELELAKDYHQHALEIFINVLGPSHKDVAKSYNNLGLVYGALGEQEQARDYHQKALEIFINVLGPNHNDVATSYNNLGLLFHDMGELEQAKNYHQRAMRTRTMVLGLNHIKVAKSYDNLGSVYRDMRELEQAKDCHQKALEIFINLLGPDHNDVATSYSNLGLVYYDMRELEKAKRYLQQALEIKINVLGPNHIKVAKLYENLGSVYRDLGELEQAKDYLQRALEIRIKVLGPNHIKLAKSYKNLGLVYHDMGEIEKAEDYYQRASEIRKEMLVPNHNNAAATCNVVKCKSCRCCCIL